MTEEERRKKRQKDTDLLCTMCLSWPWRIAFPPPTHSGSVGDTRVLFANYNMCKQICLDDFGAETYWQLTKPAIHADTCGSGTTRAHIARSPAAGRRGCFTNVPLTVHVRALLRTWLLFFCFITWYCAILLRWVVPNISDYLLLCEFMLSDSGQWC